MIITPNRNWTAATLYKRLREVLTEEGIDLEDDVAANSLTLGALRDKLKDRIVTDATTDTVPPAAPAKTEKK